MATTVLGLKTFAASDPVDYNEINDNYNKIDNGVKTAMQGRAAHNLLDNSDFLNPVNQRGVTSTAAAGYHIDRWKKENASGTVTIGNNYIAMTGTGAYWFLTQFVPTNKIKSGAVYTIALADTSGSVSVCSTVMSTDMAKFTARHTFTNGVAVTTNVEYTSDKYAVYFTSNSSAEIRFAWAALYEGSYTADTLPAYVPKDNELAECQMYYLPLNHQLLGSGYTFNGGATLLVPRKMRIDAPSFVASGAIFARVNGADYPLTLSSVTTYGSMIKVDFASNTIPVNYPCAFYADAPGVSLNADL